jgi:hypothetical protein
MMALEASWLYSLAVYVSNWRDAGGEVGAVGAEEEAVGRM